MAPLVHRNLGYVFIALVFWGHVEGFQRSLCDLCECESSRILCTNDKANASYFLEYDGSGVTSITITGYRNESLSKDTFSTFKNVLELRITSSTIEIPEDILYSLPNLTDVELRNLSMDYVPATIFLKSIKITRLNLSGNKIKILSKTLDTGENWKEKTFNESKTNSNVTSVGVFSFLNDLEILNLSDNLLTQLVEEDFSGLSKLKQLDLSNNKISTINEKVFISQENLKKINLSFNSLEYLQNESFSGLSSIEELQVSNNRVTRIQAGAFASLGALRTLNLSGNRLEELAEGAFAGLEALEELDVGGNRLLRAPVAALSPLPHLRLLRLSGNRLAAVGAALVQLLAQRPGLTAQLQGNPVHCACGEGGGEAEWQAAAAQGLLLRLQVLCEGSASGGSWDAHMRSLRCSEAAAASSPSPASGAAAASGLRVQGQAKRGEAAGNAASNALHDAEVANNSGIGASAKGVERRDPVHSVYEDSSLNLTKTIRAAEGLDMSLDDIVKEQDVDKELSENVLNASIPASNTTKEDDLVNQKQRIAEGNAADTKGKTADTFHKRNITSELVIIVCVFTLLAFFIVVVKLYLVLHKYETNELEEERDRLWANSSTASEDNQGYWSSRSTTASEGVVGIWSNVPFNIV